jgi:enoyl-CoA hydratase/carnithine racemase
MTSADLDINVVGGRLEIALNRPEKRNALHPALLADLAGAVTNPGTAHLVVLKSNLEAGFSAGFDLDVLRELGPRAHEGDPIGTAVRALVQCPVPTVAVLNGYCIGASVELVSACDLRIARSDLRLSVPANRLGAPYRPAGVDLLVSRFGWATASELLVFGMSFDAGAAVTRRLVSLVGDDAELNRHVEELSSRIAMSPAAAATQRMMLAEWTAQPTVDAVVLNRWERIREDAIMSRRIPPTREPDHRSVPRA